MGRRGQRGSFLTVATISSLVKQHGHQVQFVEIGAGDDGPNMVLDGVVQFRPDVVGLSVMSGDYPLAVEIARKLKRRANTLVLFGGVHPTMNPQETLREDSIDLVCVGEGEYPTLDLLGRIDRGEDVRGIDNIWHKVDGRIVRTPLRQLNDLDALPPPDASLIYDPHVRRVYFTITSLGCPYDCSYCQRARDRRRVHRRLRRAPPRCRWSCRTHR